MTQGENTPTETDKSSLHFVTDLRVALWTLLLHNIKILLELWLRSPPSDSKSSQNYFNGGPDAFMVKQCQSLAKNKIVLLHDETPGVDFVNVRLFTIMKGSLCGPASGFLHVKVTD